MSIANIFNNNDITRAQLAAAMGHIARLQNENKDLKHKIDCLVDSSEQMSEQSMQEWWDMHDKIIKLEDLLSDANEEIDRLNDEYEQVANERDMALDIVDGLAKALKTQEDTKQRRMTAEEHLMEVIFGKEGK